MPTGRPTKSALVRQAGEEVKLRLAWGLPPDAGDELRTISGRRYLVTKVKGKTLTCYVLPRDAPPVPGKVIQWQWASSGPRPSGARECAR
jgi:hypothetical protein